MKYVYQNANRLKDVRRFLRAHGPLAEKILWKHVGNSQLGYKFRRQFSIGNVIADFCCVSLKLIIELDGWTHEFEKTQAKDKIKEKFLKSKGYKVIRFTNEQVYGDIEVVLNEIKKICEERLTIPPPPPSP